VTVIITLLAFDREWEAGSGMDLSPFGQNSKLAAIKSNAP